MDEDKPTGIVITFHENGSAMFEYKYIGIVNPFQLYAVADYLRLQANNTILEAQNRIQQTMPDNEILKPGKILQ